MSLIQPTLDYTDRDFDSLRLRLQGLARSVYENWTDFNKANIGNILIELMSFVGDVLNFYQDNQAMETFWPTLVQRISAIRLGQLIDFVLTGASAATADETFAIPAVYTSALQIPEGTRVRTNHPQSPVRFRTTADGTISPGSVSASIAIKQSEKRAETFESSEEPNLEIVLSGTPFLDGSIDTAIWDGTTLIQGLTAANGDYYRVDSFLGYTSTDRVFVCLTDDQDKANIRFGNGVIGTIPQGEIRVAYEVGGGAAGNVDANTISILDDSLFYDDGSPATVSVTNPAPATGGADKMTLAEARVQAPASLRVLTRTVTKEDYESVARSVRGVARALMATSNEYAGIEENTGRLYIVARGIRYASGRVGPDTPTSTLLAQVESEIATNKPSTITFSYAAYAAVFRDLLLKSKVFLDRGAVGATVKSAIEAALYDFFAAQLADGLPNESIDFGFNLLQQQATTSIATQGEIVWSDVFDVINDVAGVRKVDEGADGLLINSGTGYKRQSVSLLPIEFPRLTSVILINGDTGAAL
jgi:hypothetical protein